MQRVSTSILRSACRILIAGALIGAPSKNALAFGVHGEDSRVEAAEATIPGARAWAAASAILIDDSRLRSVASPVGASDELELLADPPGLCPGERFASQPSAGFCTATLIAPGLVVTASHCMDEAGSCARTRFVFGFAASATGAPPAQVPTSDVYRCAMVTPVASDLALVRLDRPVAGRQPLRLGRGHALRAGDELAAVSYPLGQPAKLSLGRVLEAPGGAEEIPTDLDTLEGSSGAAIISRRTGRIEAIHVRGGESLSADPDTGCLRIRAIDPASRAETGRAIDVAEVRAALRGLARR